MLLSVLSALARANVDPWEEAANLVRLPGETATQRLTALIAALPDGPSADLDPRPIATRLIALLPRQAGSNLRLRKTLFGVGAVTVSRSVTYTIFINVIFIAGLLGAQWIVASRQPEARVDTAQAPTSSRAIPQTLPPSSGQ